MSLEKADSLIRLAAIDGVTLILGGKTASVKFSERRPRQVPYSYRVGVYSFLAQVLASLIILRVHELVPTPVLLFFAAVCIVVLACMCINMSAKTHQLILLLESTGLAGDARSCVFRKERVLFLCLSVLGWCTVGVLIYFGYSSL